MSTKIYNGYKLAPGTDVFALARALNDNWLEIAESIHVAQTVAIAVSMIDAARFPELADPTASTINTGSSSIPIMRAHFQVSNTRRQAAASPYKNGGIDLQGSACFVAHPQRPAEIYALLYTEIDSYREYFESRKEVSDFAYWDNSDPDESVSEDDWLLRRDTWDAVIVSEPPMCRGLTFELSTTLVGQRLIADIRNLSCVPDYAVDMIPSRTIRARSLAAALDFTTAKSPDMGIMELAAAHRAAVDANAPGLEAGLLDIDSDLLLTPIDPA